MVSKKGYIRTLEAVIGIVIILLFIFSVSPKPKGKVEQIPVGVKSSLEMITGEINSNLTLRAAVYDDGVCKQPAPLFENFCNEYPLQCEVCPLNAFIADNVHPGYQHDYRICDNPSCVLVCGEGNIECIENLPSTEVSVYTADTLVTAPADMAGSEPRLVRVWVWRAG